MPKIRKDEDEYPEEEELEEDEEEEEIEEPPKKVSLKKLPSFMRPEEKPKPKIEKPKTKRFAAFVQQAAEGVIDTETNEGMTTLESLANIIERLERIENAIGMIAS